MFQFKVRQGSIVLASGLLTGLIFPIPFVSAQQLDCRNAIVQIELNQCAALAAESADRKLNQVYRQLRAKYRGTQQEKLLINAQLAWIKFRDTNCAFARSKYEGGSIVPMINSNCLERTTKQRTEELENYLEGMEDGGF